MKILTTETRRNRLQVQAHKQTNQCRNESGTLTVEQHAIKEPLAYCKSAFHGQEWERCRFYRKCGIRQKIRRNHAVDGPDQESGGRDPTRKMVFEHLGPHRATKSGSGQYGVVGSVSAGCRRDKIPRKL